MILIKHGVPYGVFPVNFILRTRIRKISKLSSIKRTLLFSFGWVTSISGPIRNKLYWDAKNAVGLSKQGTLTSPVRLSFVLKVSLRHLRPSVIFAVKCDQILQGAYWANNDSSSDNWSEWGQTDGSSVQTGYRGIIRLHPRTIKIARLDEWSVCLPIFIHRSIIRQTIVVSPISI